MDRWAATEGFASPLGVTFVPQDQAFNFAIYSKYATGVTLLLYSPEDFAHPVREFHLDYLRNKSGRVWHCRVPAVEVDGARYYAYRVEGPFEPEQGHRFDPLKILLDPYATDVRFPPGFNRIAACQPGSNAARAPLGVINPEPIPFDWTGDVHPRHSHDTVIYELHVRGFTIDPSSGLAREKRGTYAGLAEMIPYLKDLGVTVVELMPVMQFDRQEGSFWGYMTLNFFAPHQGYASCQGSDEVLKEFRQMVKAFHQADIEIILDVVFNHTTEGNERGPTYSFRGIDNSTYYHGVGGKYIDNTGTGNMLRCSHPAVRKLVIDSLRFWVKEMHVDGFRFDLASIFTRKNDGSVDLEDPPVISEISADPDFQNVRLIAEAWDLDCYLLGRSFPGVAWLQWNGKFRDDIRCFVKSDPDLVNALMMRLYGSDDLFPDALSETYHPYQSVNFVTSHDGFCLYDLVAYNEKNNWANGHNNTDGSDCNYSWDCVDPGEDEDSPAVIQRRKQQIRNFCCLLFLANGTPMFCAGDEFMRTQGGNNNPYNQDNETTWINWDLLKRNEDIYRFFKNMIAFRKAHPSLGRSRFWRDDIRWYGVGPSVDRSRNSHSLAFCLHGESQGDRDIYVMINAWWRDLVFTIQEGPMGKWRRVIDTSQPCPADFLEPGSEVPQKSSRCRVRPRSIVVLVSG